MQLLMLKCLIDRTHSSKYFGNFDVLLTLSTQWAKLWEFYDSYLKCVCKNKQYTPQVLLTLTVQELKKDAS